MLVEEDHNFYYVPNIIKNRDSSVAQRWAKTERRSRVGKKC